MKYIIVNPAGVELAILFPDSMPHSAAVNRDRGQPVSAGFCRVEAAGRVEVYGESMTLDLKSRPGCDEKVIQRTLHLIRLEGAQVRGAERGVRSDKENLEWVPVRKGGSEAGGTAEHTDALDRLNAELQREQERGTLNLEPRTLNLERGRELGTPNIEHRTLNIERGTREVGP